MGVAGRLDTLLVGLMDAKAKEDAAKARRIAIEEEIANLVETPDKGQKTVRLPSGWGITVKRGYNFSANVESMKAAWAGLAMARELGLGFPVPLKVKESLDEKGYEWYRKNHPNLFSLLAEHVTAKPKKVSVSFRSPKEEGQ